MEKIRKNFGFGCMRLPMIGEDVDMEQTKQMVDCFLEQGFNYFDTAHGYLQGKSELALKECLTSRYPREDYVLTDKLSGSYFKKEEDIRPLFESQLAACGVDYFDFYLMHSQSTTNYQHYRDCRAYETAFALKAEGKVRHVGISFHDRAAVLEQILTDYPAIEVVQIQFNYLDYDDVAVQSRKCYEVCRRHGKPVLVMEPVKGGSLVNLPDDAKAVLDALHGGSPASYAIRFAAGFPGMLMVLSGMSSMEQMQDNLSYMKDFTPLNDAERTAVSKVVEIFRKQDLIRWGLLKASLDDAKNKMKAMLDHTPYTSELTGKTYEFDLIGSKVYYKYDVDGETVQLHGLDFGEAGEPEGTGWTLFTSKKTDGTTEEEYIKSGTTAAARIDMIYQYDPDVHMFWPLFKQSITTNSLLVNDYGYPMQ